MPHVFPEAVVLQPKRTWNAFEVFGLQVSTGPVLDFAIAQRSLARGKLSVHETGSVGQIEFRSTSSRHTLVLEGSRLIGGRQDRVVNTSVLIAPGAKVTVAVSCVEQNRWHARKGVDATVFAIAEELAGPEQRSVLKETTGDGHRADQGSVWESVDATVTSLNAGNGSGTLSQAFERVEGKRDEALAALGYVEGANGISIIVGGQLRTIEAFNNCRKMRQSWAGIVSAHLVERVTSRGAFEAAELATTLDSVTAADWKPVAAASIGSESRSTVGKGRASVLYLDNSLVHASVVF